MSLSRIRQQAEELAEHAIYLLFSHRAHFLNPLVTRERDSLSDCVALADDRVLEVVERIGSERTEIGPGLFFPAPLARALEAETPWDTALHRFSYEMIRVSDEGQWSWKGGAVAPRTRDFFLEHLRYEPELDRWLFEYRVNDGWWDKSYLDAAITPLTGIRLEPGESGQLEVECASGQRAALVGSRLRLDPNERLFAEVEGLGEVLLTRNQRFEVLKTVSEDLSRVEVAGVTLNLEWPPQ